MQPPRGIENDSFGSSQLKRHFLAVSACFALSGFAALVYQTAWMRQFAIVFGTAHLAVATVLAAYMAGLALGAYLIGRLMHRIRRPLLTYAVLEAGIATCALAIPWVLAGIRWLQVVILGGQAAPPDSAGFMQTAFYTSVAFIALAAPTAFMGATLPLLARYAVQRDQQVGPRIGLLYGLNTAGAVAGVILAGYLLVPNFGLFGTVLTGVAANFLVFLIASGLSRGAEAAQSVSNRTVKSASDANRAWRWMLPLIAVSGANAFYLEVLWSRLLNHVFGGTLIAFTTMLATFLVGIAIGGSVGGRFAKTKQRAGYTFALAQVAIAIGSLTTYLLIDTIVPTSADLAQSILMAAIIMLPSTIFIGATFPLAVRNVVIDERDATVGTARVYAWNTVGAIFGALLAGFYLIPALGFSLSAKASGLVSLLLAFASLLFLCDKMRTQLVSLGIAIIAVALFYDAPRPENLLRAAVNYGGKEVNEIFYAVGRSATVMVLDVDGRFEMRSDGLPESTIYRIGSPPSKHSQYWLTALPAIARPEADDLLMIGLGGGVALEALPDTLATIDVIEIEPEVVAANDALAELRRRNPFEDERIRLVINDARSALSLTSKTYDIIVSQPSHPWTAGASHLYTREFLQLAKSHMNDNGVFLQWINAQYVNEELLKTLAATMADVFSNVRLYQPLPNVLLFLGANGTLDIEPEIVQSKSLAEFAHNDYRQVGIASAEDIASALMLDNDRLRLFAAGAIINTDNRNMLATHSLPRGDGMGAVGLRDLLRSRDALLHRDGTAIGHLGDQLDYGYIATQLVQTRFEQRAFELARTFNGSSVQYLIDGIGYASFGQSAQAQQAFAEAVRLDATDAAATFSLIKPYLGQIGTAQSYTRLEAAAAALPASALAVVRGWQAGQRGDWEMLRSLDAELADIRATDLWYPIGAKLRVDWRLAFAQSSTDSGYGQQGLELLDGVLAFYWNFDLYVLRAACAFVADKPQAFLESAWWASELVASKVDKAVEGKYAFSQAEYATTASRLLGLSREIERSGGAGGLSSRALQVLGMLNDTVHRMQQLAATN
jgi:spermidine synthase